MDVKLITEYLKLVCDMFLYVCYCSLLYCCRTTRTYGRVPKTSIDDG